MDALLVERIGLIIGFVLCAIVAVHALVYLQSSIRRSSHEKKQKELEKESLYKCVLTPRVDVAC